MGAYRVLYALSTTQPDTTASSTRFKPEEISPRHYLPPVLEKFAEIPRVGQLLSKERPHWTVAAGVLAIVVATWAAIRLLEHRLGFFISYRICSIDLAATRPMARLGARLVTAT